MDRETHERVAGSTRPRFIRAIRSRRRVSEHHVRRRPRFTRPYMRRKREPVAPPDLRTTADDIDHDLVTAMMMRSGPAVGAKPHGADPGLVSAAAGEVERGR